MRLAALIPFYIFVGFNPRLVRRRLFALRLGLGDFGRGVVERLEHLGRDGAVDAVAFGDLAATRAAEAFFERDDGAGVGAVDRLDRRRVVIDGRRLRNGRRLLLLLLPGPLRLRVVRPL